MRMSDSADVGLREDYEDALADVGCNAELYIIVNHPENTDLLRSRSAYGGCLVALHGPGPILLSVI